MTRPEAIDVDALEVVLGGTRKAAFNLNVYRNDKPFAQQYEMRCVSLSPGKYFCTGSPHIADSTMP